ncbi:MAG: MFS transporter [Alcaligenaceae bacterium]|nr:MFS transporter [Alcaligenaceae bacterium]
MNQETPFSWKKIAVPAYGPSVLFGIGNGAILPIVALTAIDLGASSALSGLIVALIGLGSLLSNLPGALVISRFGERRSLLGASLMSVLAMVLCILATDPWVLAVGVSMFGVSTSVFYLARQTYLIEMVPFELRARALATLGGAQRIGSFAGPFISAAAMHAFGLDGAYAVAICVLFLGGIICYYMPELPVPARPAGHGPMAKPRLTRLAVEHRKVFLTLGLGAACVAAMRAARQIAIPLWAVNIGLSPSVTAVVFGCVSAVDMLVFYPAGKIMDTYGRVWVALPCALLLGLSFIFIPSTSQLWSFVIVCLLMGFGNGIGSGLVMTLGADAAPRNGRTEFIGLWRLIADIGNSAGPFVVSGITAWVSLAAGITLTGVFGVLAAGIFWWCLPHGKRQP